jgi:deoxyribodipyrimidine photo-lyase
MTAAKKYKTLIVWFRRDLRVSDNASLHHACRQAEQVVPLFILDDAILKRQDTGAARVEFLLDALAVLDRNLQKRTGRLIVRHGKTPEALMQAVRDFNADGVFHHREYEPHGRKRDEQVAQSLTEAGKVVETFKDITLFEPGEIQTAAGRPYTVFGPYKRQWFSQPADAPLAAPERIAVPESAQSDPLPTAQDLHFRTSQTFECGGEDRARQLLHEFCKNKLTDYGTQRDQLAVDGTSKLSRHLHLGTIGLRTIVQEVRKYGQNAQAEPDLDAETRAEHQTKAGGAESFLNELAWHDFYMEILSSFPHVTDGAFRPQYDALQWENDEALFDAWKAGRTGYPVVDAAMRQLNSEAWMHNRGRMIVASFLTKDLLIDWRWGERYFMERLVDGDQAANNGGWQWAAGTGTDAQPFFRIFNPTTQGEKFDPQGDYVRRWIPELARVPTTRIHTPWKLSIAERDHLGCADYPNPIVDHAQQRTRALALYGQAAQNRNDA